MKTAKTNVKKEVVYKSIFVTVFQWLYLGFGVMALSFPLWINLFPGIKGFNLPLPLLVIPAVLLAFYCLLLSFSFFSQNSTLLILALVFIFFTTLGGLSLLGFSIFNIKAAFHGLPECLKQIKDCGSKDALIIASFTAFATSIPILLLNILTIIATVNAIAARA